MRFELPILLWVSPAVVLLIALLAFWAQRRRIRLAAAWSPSLGERARRTRRLSVPLLALAALGAALGAAGPRGGRMEQIAESRGLNVLLAVDVSRSMLAEDVEPNRLRRAVREARRLLQDLPGDRIGIVAFAGQSYALTPLTLDHSAIDMYLEALDPDLASTGGTNLGAALRQAEQLLAASLEGGDRAVVMFTDGEGHDSLGPALEAARALGREGVRVILVAEGGREPVRIPLRDATGAVTGYKRDLEGRIVTTWRRDEVLQAVTREAGGVLLDAELPDQAGAVRDVLRGLSRRPLSERRLADLQPLAWIAALLAALLLLLHSTTRRTTALAGLATLAVLPALQAQNLGRAHRLLERGRLLEAEAEFRGAALRGQGGDSAWFNAGAAALAAGRLEEAVDALERAVRSVDPGLRYRALYNLGLANLLAARRDTAGRAAREGAATDAFKEALLLQPRSEPAKWNLELLAREQPPPSSGGQSQRQQSEQQPDPADRSESGLSPSEAEALLSSVERNELSTRLNAMRRQRLRTAASAKDW